MEKRSRKISRNFKYEPIDLSLGGVSIKGKQDAMKFLTEETPNPSVMEHAPTFLKSPNERSEK